MNWREAFWRERNFIGSTGRESNLGKSHAQYLSTLCIYVCQELYILSGLCSNCKLRGSAITFQMRTDRRGSSVVWSQANEWLKTRSAWLETFEEHERLKVGLEVFSPLETCSGPYFFLEFLKCPRKFPLDHWVVWLSCPEKLRSLDVLFACFSLTMDCPLTWFSYWFIQECQYCGT